jgi:hypothetical protein
VRVPEARRLGRSPQPFEDRVEGPGRRGLQGQHFFTNELGNTLLDVLDLGRKLEVDQWFTPRIDETGSANLLRKRRSLRLITR